jgi:CRISPR type I-E-associated protein CasA/Cse1
MSYDLLTEAFVPCARLDGTVDELGLVDLYRQAHTIREIADPSPMTTFGMYRLLLATLQWLRPLAEHSEWADLWRTNRFPEELVEALHDRGRGRFDLLDDQYPFYQERVSADAATRPAADLLYEVPGDTEINLFRHTYDSRLSLCLACCAKGLIRLPAFGTQGGRGLAPSINNAPPMYFLPLGDNLFQTLLLNVADIRFDHDLPAWEGTTTSGPIGVQEGLTWRCRTVGIDASRLVSGTCCLCGRVSSRTVGQLVCRMGRSRREESHRPWRDPHVAYIEKDRGASELRPTDVASVARWGAWRDAWSAILPQPDGPCSVQSIETAIARLRAVHPVRDLSVLLVGLHSRQAKRLHDQQARWTVPSSLFDSPQAVRSLRNALDLADQMLMDWQHWRLDDSSLASARTDKQKRRKPTDRRERAIAAHRLLVVPHLEHAAEVEFGFLVRRIAQDPASHAEHLREWQQLLSRLLARCAGNAPTHDLQPTSFLDRIEACTRFSAEVLHTDENQTESEKP